MHGILNSTDAHMRIGLPNSLHLNIKSYITCINNTDRKGLFSLYALIRNSVSSTFSSFISYKNLSLFDKEVKATSTFYCWQYIYSPLYPYTCTFYKRKGNYSGSFPLRHLQHIYYLLTFRTTNRPLCGEYRSMNPFGNRRISEDRCWTSIATKWVYGRVLDCVNMGFWKWWQVLYR